jgi:hypothetical protein
MRARIVAAAIAVVAVALGVTALAVAARNGPEARKATVLEMTWKLVAAEDVDVGAEGRGPGDMLIRRFEILVRGEPAGSGQTSCILNVEPFVMCVHQLALTRRGTLATVHLGDQSDEGEQVPDAIIGGTGEFRNAGGEVTFDFSGPGTDLRVVAKIVR